MFEAEEKHPDFTLDSDSSVNPEGNHVKLIEKMADLSGVPKGEILPPLDQQSDKHCTWENDLKYHDLKR